MNIQVEAIKTQRLDVYLTKRLPELSRSRIQSLLKSGDILLNDGSAKPKTPVSEGDTISVNIPEPEPEEAQPEEIPLNILYEDEEIIVLNKESGMVVHPAAGNASGTLVNALLHHCDGKLADLGGAERPGIVHRLDKDTSGCIIVAKTNVAHASLVEQFANRTTEKEYLCVVQGRPAEPEGRIENNIGRHPVNRMKMTVVDPGSGKESMTDYTVLAHCEENDSSFIHCKLHTGRTHQIRVHMVHIGTPILGDVIYAKVPKQTAQPGRLMLHARRLCITHPVTNERLEFKAPYPTEYQPWIDIAGNKSDSF